MILEHWRFLHMNIITKTILAAGVATSLGGCVSNAEIKAAAIRDTKDTCASMGFTPDTDAFRTCVFNGYQQMRNRQVAQEAQEASVGDRLIAAGAAMQRAGA